MQIKEFDISPAVVFHNQLNPALWLGNSLRPDVHTKLMNIADDFQQFIGVDLYDILDITVSGSNAAFTYTPNSDIDLHLVVAIPAMHDQELRELFDAKKYQYNNSFDFKIRGYDVELYVQDAAQAHASMGIYSIKNNQWNREPTQSRATVDDVSVKSKYQNYVERIKQCVDQDNLSLCTKLFDSIRSMRQAGLQQGGEFSAENVTFKMLRAKGNLQELRDHMTALKIKKMSLESQHA